MKVTVVGAGPAGLYAAWALKRADPAHAVSVLERGARDERPGLGITLPAYALGWLTRDDPRPALIDALTPPWSTAQVHVNGQPFTFPFGALAGVPRAALVGYLERRCAEVGVDLRFGQRVEVDDVARLAAESDLLVGADGAGSVVRGRDEAAFGAALADGPNPYAWLAADRGLPEMRLGFQQTPGGMLLCAAYPYAADRSTVIVECSLSAHRAAGLASQVDATGALDADARELLGVAFASVLDGARLLDVGATWRRFRCVRTRRLVSGNIALVGDAAATYYYSFGAGTPLALRAAATLAGLVASTPDLSRALARYEAELRPHLDGAQDAAEHDMRSMAGLDGVGFVDPAAFAQAYVSRFDG